MSASLSALDPELQPYARALVDAAGAAGLLPKVTSTRRSHAEQERLYRRFLAGQQPYPVARPGTSAHEYGWAFDLVVSPMEALSDVGDYWEREIGGVWGGHPRRKGSGYDPVHFEYPNWRSFVDWSSPDLRQQQDERSFGLFPFTAPGKLQEEGLSLAGFLPGIPGYIADAVEFLRAVGIAP